ncbi:MAG: hypothetical protein HJJLKODD_00890 [Phycisphaerae bacterium]|nr:hypothetical protein [Phycisphaerae bacterium]
MCDFLRCRPACALMALILLVVWNGYALADDPQTTSCDVSNNDRMIQQWESGFQEFTFYQAHSHGQSCLPTPVPHSDLEPGSFGTDAASLISGPWGCAGPIRIHPAGVPTIVFWRQPSWDSPQATDSLIWAVYVGWKDRFHETPTTADDTFWRWYTIPNATGVPMQDRLKQPRIAYKLDSNGRPIIAVGMDNGGVRYVNSPDGPVYFGSIDLLQTINGPNGQLSWSRESVPFSSAYGSVNNRLDYPSLQLTPNGLIVTALGYPAGLDNPDAGKPVIEPMMARKKLSGSWVAQRVLQNICPPVSCCPVYTIRPVNPFIINPINHFIKDPPWTSIAPPPIGYLPASNTEEWSESDWAGDELANERPVWSNSATGAGDCSAEGLEEGERTAQVLPPLPLGGIIPATDPVMIAACSPCGQPACPFSANPYLRYQTGYPAVAQVDNNTTRMTFTFGERPTSGGNYKNFVYTVDYNSSAANFNSSGQLPVLNKILVDSNVTPDANNDYVLATLDPTGQYLFTMKEKNDPLYEPPLDVIVDTTQIYRRNGLSWTLLAASEHQLDWWTTGNDYDRNSYTRWWLPDMILALPQTQYAYIAPVSNYFLGNLIDMTDGATTSYFNSGAEPDCDGYFLYGKLCGRPVAQGLEGDFTDWTFETSMAVGAFPSLGLQDNGLVAFHSGDGRVVLRTEFNGLPYTEFGDADFDCDYDQIDLNAFNAAFSGSGVPTRNPLFDYDIDGDVDSADAAHLPTQFGSHSYCYTPPSDT